MKALPKHCLPHHAVLLLVYLSALFLTSRAANLPNLFYMAFNGLVLGLSAAYLRRDFDTDLFRLKRTAANVVRQVLTGLGLGCLLAMVFAGVAMLFEDISLFPRLGIQNVAGFILVQMIVALAEEAYFNYYLYDTLMRLFRGKAVWSMAAAAALFAGGTLGDERQREAGGHRLCLPAGRPAGPADISPGQRLLRLRRDALFL